MKTIIALALLLICAVGLSAQQRFVAAMTAEQENPPVNSPAKGTCKILLNAAETQITVNCTFSGLTSNINNAHIHGNAPPGTNAGVLFGFTGLPVGTSGTIGPLTFTVTPTQLADMRAHRHYANIHSVNFPGGEIRGQIKQVQTVYDNDGDGRTDAVTFRQSTNTFWFLKSLNGSPSTFNHGTGVGDNFLNLTNDFDGDGRGDPLLIKLEANVATWSIYQTGNNTVRNVQWGNFGAGFTDSLAMADYDGDGTQDIAVFRRATGQWWIIDSSTGTSHVENWGILNDFPSVGDYDGDGKADLTTVRAEGANRVFYIRQSSNGTMRREIFGASSDGVFFFAPIDIDGDGKQDVMVNRAIAGQRTFFILRSTDAQVAQIGWGATTDLALFGDYDGDGRTDFVARRAVSGVFVWQILRSSDSQIQYIYWGITGDQLLDEPSGDELYRSMIGYGV